MALRTLASKKVLSFPFGGAGRPLAAAASARGVTTVTLPDLSYDFGALEPAISGEIMRLHHQKHHATYVANYNKALEQLDTAVSKGDASAVVQLQGAIKFNGGGESLPCTRSTSIPFLGTVLFLILGDYYLSGANFMGSMKAKCGFFSQSRVI
jgi:hypothetical protein